MPISLLTRVNSPRVVIVENRVNTISCCRSGIGDAHQHLKLNSGEARPPCGVAGLLHSLRSKLPSGQSRINCRNRRQSRRAVSAQGGLKSREPAHRGSVCCGQNPPDANRASLLKIMRRIRQQRCLAGRRRYFAYGVINLNDRLEGPADAQLTNRHPPSTAFAQQRSLSVNAVTGEWLKSGGVSVYKSCRYFTALRIVFSP